MVKGAYHGAESISYLGTKIWDILLETLKNIENLEHFKKKIKTYKPDNCPYKLCKVYIEGIGLISLIFLKLRISLWNSCVVYLCYYQIYIFHINIILYIRILVGLSVGYLIFYFFTQNVYVL